MKKLNNIAFIDGQNLHLGTTSENWKVDFKRFRVYLKDKFKIDEAYIFFHKNKFFIKIVTSSLFFAKKGKKL